eukprot:TRINITY_DN6873_c0_g1_i2.p1 TRINITY_DN6873_c0_g1~~TRINITY_DN6873_c0_g1_i2.p1  ORF type:complete len:123 (-),score=29.58 TRINITY_DN6873_c0_g1_i2:48-416(-)
MCIRDRVSTQSTGVKDNMSTRYFFAYGKVQQTLIRAAQKRKLKAGASNSKQDRTEVSFTLSGENSKIQEIVDFMKSGRELNSWGAKVTNLKEVEKGKSIEEHRVTTENVDEFNWKEGVEMYL